MQPKESGLTPQWRKKSIFLNLLYWEFNLLRHNLDVIHIDKNVCNNILYTLLNDKNKRKDHLAARKDMKSMKIRSQLWSLADEKTCPAASFTLDKKKIEVVLKSLIKFYTASDVEIKDAHAKATIQRVEDDGCPPDWGPNDSLAQAMNKLEHRGHIRMTGLATAGSSSTFGSVSSMMPQTRPALVGQLEHMIISAKTELG